MSSAQLFTIIGAGPAGALLATLLARAGLQVEVFDQRQDPELGPLESGRSINLALAERGLHALRQAGVDRVVQQQAVMMRGRIVHSPEQASQLLRYGPDDREVLWSINRHSLSLELCRAARAAGARLYFGQTLRSVDFQHQQLYLADGQAAPQPYHFECLIGADGAGSAVRRAMQSEADLGEHFEALGHAYKELEIPARADPAARFAIEPHGLHIWPRQAYMSIALPNHDGSFTVTLFLPLQGPGPNFAELHTPAAARALFAAEFPDLLALIPDFERDYATHPIGRLGTLRLRHWHHHGAAVLLGDAAHAIVPFHGQGMNCALEDAVALADGLVAAPNAAEARAAVFAAFQHQRQPQAEAIAQMALENYIEMRDSVTDPVFLARRHLATALAAAVPNHFMSRYRMVSFTRLDYAYALARGQQQDQWLDQLLARYPDPAGRDLAQAAADTRQHLPALPGKP